jgi:hypothetical protein
MKHSEYYLLEAEIQFDKKETSFSQMMPWKDFQDMAKHYGENSSALMAAESEVFGIDAPNLFDASLEETAMMFLLMSVLAEDQGV